MKIDVPKFVDQQRRRPYPRLSRWPSISAVPVFSGARNGADDSVCPDFSDSIVELISDVGVPRAIPTDGMRPGKTREAGLVAVTAKAGDSGSNKYGYCAVWFETINRRCIQV